MRHIDDDARLMLRVKKGDLDAFNSLITRYRNPVIQTLCRITGVYDDAEDLAQEVFLRLYRARKTYKVNAKFTTWLFRIVRNIASNAVRDRSRRRKIQVLSDGLDKIADNMISASTQPGPEEIVSGRDLQERLKKALMLLSFSQRTAIVLSRLEGMSYAEVADIMENSEGAVKMLVSRAKKILARELKDYV